MISQLLYLVSVYSEYIRELHRRNIKIDGHPVANSSKRNYFIVTTVYAH